MHFSQSVSIIQSQVGIIRGVQVLYSDTVSFEQKKNYILNWRKKKTKFDDEINFSVSESVRSRSSNKFTLRWGEAYIWPHCAEAQDYWNI